MKEYTFAELYQKRFMDIPCKPGVYFVHVSKGFEKKFINPGTGGYFKCKNPNVTEEKLNLKWVEGAEILYIGQTTKDLRKRIALYTAFGAGYPVPHWGGRYIWQIKNAMKVISVSWEEDAHPKEREKGEIDDFKKGNDGWLPFANLR